MQDNLLAYIHDQDLIRTTILELCVRGHYSMAKLSNITDVDPITLNRFLYKKKKISSVTVHKLCDFIWKMKEKGKDRSIE